MSNVSPVNPVFEKLILAAKPRIRKILQENPVEPGLLEKKDAASPVVTRIDQEVELALREVISELAPQDGILGEEFPEKIGQSGRRWILDPIDGTIALCAGKPTFTTLVGLQNSKGEFEAGWIYQPVLDDSWFYSGAGATLRNGVEQSCSRLQNLSSCILSTTTPDFFETRTQKEFWEELNRKTWLTSYGSDAYAYGLLASGRVHAVIERGLALHDFAALVPVLKGSGAIITDWRGQAVDSKSEGHVIAACSTEVHQQILKLLQTKIPPEDIF